MNKKISLEEIFKILKENIRTILATTVVFSLIGLGVSNYLNEDVYSSSASLIVGEERNVETGEVNPETFEPIYRKEIVYDSDVAISDRKIEFYSKIIKSNEVLDKLIEDMNLETSPETMRNDISINRNGDSSIIEVEVTSTKLQSTNIIANKLSRLFINTVSETTGVEDVRIINLAEEVYISKSENVLRNIVVVTVLGLIVGVVIVLVLDFLNDEITSEDDLKEIGLNILANIKSDPHNVNLDEQIKILYTKIQNYYDTGKLKNILLLPVSEEVSDISIKLASVISKSKKKVLLLDANFRNPQIHQKLNLSNKPGFLNVLENSDKIESSLNDDADDMNVLTAGEPNEKITELLYLDNTKNMLEIISSNYEYIISNASSIDNLSDSLIMSILSDGVILVIRREKDRLSEVSSVLNQLEKLDIKVLGAILK